MFLGLSAKIIFLLIVFACSENEQSKFEFRIAEDHPAPDLTEIVFESTGKIFYLNENAFINQKEVESAAVVMQHERTAVPDWRSILIIKLIYYAKA